MKIKALVIDLDGTLYEKKRERMADLASGRRTYVYLKTKGILPRVSKHNINTMNDSIRRGYVTIALRSISQKYGINLKDIETYSYDLDPKSVGIKRDKKLIRLLTLLSRKYRLAIFTNGYANWAARVLNTLGISNLIDKKMIVSVANLGKYVKPEAGAFRILMKRIRFKEDELLFLDDNANNIKQARRMGIKSILVKNEGRNKRRSIHSILKGIEDAS